jgi:hypothetical protein
MKAGNGKKDGEKLYKEGDEKQEELTHGPGNKLAIKMAVGGAFRFCIISLASDTQTRSNNMATRLLHVILD